MTLPGWPPRDWRAFLALVASVVGAAVLTGFAAWLVWILWRWKGFDELRIDALAKSLFGTLLIIGVVLVSLGLAINKRSVNASLLGASFSASGGDDDPPDVPSSPTVTTTTTVAPTQPGAQP